MALSANIGEWSEIYVLFRLLADGKMAVADVNLNPIPNLFYDILGVIRKETSSLNIFERSQSRVNISVTNDITSEVTHFDMPVEVFEKQADILLANLISKGAAHQPETEAFMHSIKIYSVKASSESKRDITLKIRDFHTSMEHTLGFSIKSFIGSNSTLFNPGAITNFIYRVNFPNGVSVDCDSFNKETINGDPDSKAGKLFYRVQKLANDYHASFEFVDIQRGSRGDCFFQNLRTIDGDMPQILAKAMLYRFLYNANGWNELSPIFNERNPLSYRLGPDAPVYDYKIKRFLQDCALGMTPGTPWSGIYDAAGGQIVVKRDGIIVCYHVYELNQYLQYLFNSTYLDSPSTSEDENYPGRPAIDPKTGKPSKPYCYGWLYKADDGNYYIKLNLQVRFRKPKTKRSNKKSY